MDLDCVCTLIVTTAAAAFAQRLAARLGFAGLSKEKRRGSCNACHVEEQGVCKICTNPPTGGNTSQSRLHVDHDHKTGKNRALLCSNCNTGVGQFQDNPVLLRAAAEYLEGF